MKSILYRQTDFPSRDILYPYKDEMVECYFKNSPNGKGNCVYTNEVIEKDIIPRIYETVASAFMMKVEKISSHIYVQNNEKKITTFHHHMAGLSDKLDSSLTAALYLDSPKVGGEFQLMPRYLTPEYFEDYEDNLKEHTFDVEDNKLYFFPSWWMHRPLPQEDETYRVCITFDIYSFDRPMFLLDNTVW